VLGAERLKNSVICGTGGDMVITAATHRVAHTFDMVGKAAVAATVGSFWSDNGRGLGGPYGSKSGHGTTRHTFEASK
jgi:hypothetical protein